MSQSLQTFAALAIVAIAAGWFVRHAIAKRRNPGCGSGCPTDGFKAKMKGRTPPPL